MANATAAVALGAGWSKAKNPPRPRRASVAMSRMLTNVPPGASRASVSDGHAAQQVTVQQPCRDETGEVGQRVALPRAVDGRGICGGRAKLGNGGSEARWRSRPSSKTASTR